MRRLFEQTLIGVCAAVQLIATPGCLLVGYSAENDSSASLEADQRRSGPSDAGPASHADARVAADAGGAADARVTADAGSPSTPKVLGCGLLETCLPACSSGSCQVNCAQSELCWTTCEAGTSCTIDCTNGSICDMNCHAGASCAVDCRNNRDCDYLGCELGASCVLYCGNNLLGCSLTCAGAAMTCANNVHVCDAPCPTAAVVQ